MLEQQFVPGFFFYWGQKEPASHRINTAHFLKAFTYRKQSIVKFQDVFDQQQSGAVEACWAHNPEVRGSKPRSASDSFIN